MELPLRPPGALTWPHVAKHGRRVKRLEMIREREMRDPGMGGWLGVAGGWLGMEKLKEKTYE
jgi:hypothetical protein